MEFGLVLICHLCSYRKTLEVVIRTLTSPMQKNWLSGWVLGKPQTPTPLNLVRQLMEMLTVTWFWVNGNVLTTFRKSTKALEGVHNKSSVLF